MNAMMKNLILGLPFARALWTRLKAAPGPAPHSVKQRAVAELARAHGAKIFVETGTYRGDMVAAMQPNFDKLYSIELSPELHRAAVRRFEGQPAVEILFGDSGQVMGALMPRLTGKAVFWLDGHFSGGETAQAALDTPIWAELEHILAAPDLGHVILIDDARLFGRDPAYPTVAAIADFVTGRRPNVRIDVADDSIRILPTPV